MDPNASRNRLQAFLHQAGAAAHRCSRIFLPLFLTLLAIRALAFLYIARIHYVPSIWASFPVAVHQDLKAALLLTLLLSPFAVLFRKRLARGLLLHTPIIILLLIHTGLVFYFTTLLQPLDRSILRHSLEEVRMVLEEFGAFHPLQLGVIIPPLLYLLFYRLLPSLPLKGGPRSLLIVPVLLGIAFFNGISTPAPTSFEDQRSYYLSSNKTLFFFSSLARRPEASSEEGIVIDEAIDRYQRSQPERRFLSKQYPLLHPAAESSSLSPYFELQEERPPNFVFLIVESLSGAFTGEEAHEHSFTPYLDSLAKEGLYFPNFLSVGERTFSVLPASFGSLPHGEKGFINTGDRMPRHHTLQSLLGPQGYGTAFFYGGDASYSNYRSFMQRQGVEAIHDQAAVDSSKKRNSDKETPAKADDAQLLEMAHRLLDNGKLGTPPYLHAYLTITMHYPFVFEGQERYIEKLDSILEREIADPEERDKYRNYEKALSATLYTDDAIRSFMKEYQKRPEYENTIFFIFGDHRMAQVKYRDELDPYHVPLIVHSPLLERSKEFPAISTHLDLPPTILSLLREHYAFELPERVPWLGRQLDTSEHFRSERNCLFMLNSAVIEQSLHQEHFLSKGEAHRVEAGASLRPIEDEELADTLRREARIRKLVGRYVVKDDRILPPTQETNKELLASVQELEENAFGPDSEYEMLLQHEFEEGLQEVRVELEIPFSKELEGIEKDSMPLLVTTIGDDERSYWSSDPVDELIVPEGQEGRVIHLHRTIRGTEEVDLAKGKVLKLYFWNRKKAEERFPYRIRSIRIEGVPR